MRYQFIVLTALGTLVLIGAGEKTPCFLLIGQSNIIGYVDSRRLRKTLQILSSKESATQIKSKLITYFKSKPSSPPTPVSVFEWEASELIKARSKGYLPSSFDNPLPSVTCSFTQLNRHIDYRNPKARGEHLAVNARLSPDAKCGINFGPELMIGHILDKNGTFSEVRLIKVGAGNTTIQTHWSKESGRLWPQIVEQVNGINTKKEEWKGVIWFQGEGDSNHTLQQAKNYHGELKTFVSSVRTEIYNVDKTAFSRPSDIPFNVIGLGCAVAKHARYGRIVMNAQQNLTSYARNTFLIPTHDLSCDEHYDEASMLVIGQRVGLAMLKQL